MIKINTFASEHKLVPNNLLLSSERTDKNHRDYWLNHNDNLTPYDNYSFDVYCTYAWIETDELETSNDDECSKFPIAVMDYKPSYSRRAQFVFSEPIWNFIENERTSEQQQFIDRNLGKLNDIWIDCAQNQGYLLEIK